MIYSSNEIVMEIKVFKSLILPDFEHCDMHFISETSEAHLLETKNVIK